MCWIPHPMCVETPKRMLRLQSSFKSCIITIIVDC